jgi:hypothetical protein
MATEKRWVIFVVPHQSVGGRPGSLYIAPDGSITIHKSEAASFLTQGAAKAFADHHEILLGGPIHIGEEEFHEP